MGRQNEDKGLIGSSIVLLQERFKKLQRLKEMREKPLLELLPRSCCDDKFISKQKEGVGTSENVCKDPLALGLASNGQYIEHFGIVKNQQCTYTIDGSSCNLFENKDVVDTSLHL